MCGIVAVVTDYNNSGFDGVLQANFARGRDGFGVFNSRHGFNKYPGNAWTSKEYPSIQAGVTLANFRAEPTTEAVFRPTVVDQQPYRVGNWTVVHNGTIANDKRLCEVFRLEPPTKIDSWVIAGVLDAIDKAEPDMLHMDVFHRMITYIQGSYSIFAHHPALNGVFYATNYRPLYYHWADKGFVISSVRYPDGAQPILPYTMGFFDQYGFHKHRNIPRIQPHKYLVVLSGGLDSTVAASLLIDKGYDVEFLHFDYGARATRAERRAVEAIAAFYKRPLRVVPLNDLFTGIIGGSRLTDPEAKFAPSIEGAEQAIEWVPARNSIMAMIAMGIAEAHGFGYIALGINNEESGGGYTDNVLDLYDGFNDLNQWIVGVNRKVEFVSPLGSMMKRHIVEAGLRTKAPLHLTWSCYNDGNQHCGNCGPCFMRKTAFEINGAVDPVFNCEEV